jgi:hypothetical protein
MPAHVYGWRSRPPARRGPRQCSPPRCSHPILPLAGMIASAISRAVQRLGTRGCAEKMAQEFGITRMWRPSGCAGRASSPPSRPRSDRLHGTQDRAASRSGTRAASQHPKEARKALAVIATAQLVVVLDATIVQHPTAQPEEQ